MREYHGIIIMGISWQYDEIAHDDALAPLFFSLMFLRIENVVDIYSS